MTIQDLTRALLAWATRHRTPSPELDRARLKRALASKLPPHLLKDVGADDG